MQSEVENKHKILNSEFQSLEFRNLNLVFFQEEVNYGFNISRSI